MPGVDSLLTHIQTCILTARLQPFDHLKIAVHRGQYNIVVAYLNVRIPFLCEVTVQQGYSNLVIIFRNLVSQLGTLRFPAEVG
jgi:hypothetical protein